MKRAPNARWRHIVVAWALMFLWGAEALSGQADPVRSYRDDPMRAARAQWQPPGKIMDAIGLEEGMVVGEVGSGACGGFTFYLAERVGESGRLYAEDINERALTSLLGEMEVQGFHHVEPVLGLASDPRFPVQVLDRAIMVGMWGFFDHPVELLDNLIPSLKPGASVVIVDSKSRTEAILEVVEASRLEAERVETWPERDNIIVLVPRER